MSDAQHVRKQAKRARTSIEGFCEFVRRHGAEIDVALEAEKIRRQLNGERPRRAKDFIARAIVKFADHFESLQRPHEELRRA